MIGWFTQPYTNLPLLDGPGSHWAHSEYVAQHWSVMIGWSTQPFTNLPLLDGPGPHWAHSEYVTQHKKPDGIGTLPSYVSRKPHWNLVGLLGGHRKRLRKMVHQNKNIKTKNTKNNLLPYFTPNVSNIHVIPKSWLLWSLHTNNVWEDRTLGSPQNSADLMSPMFGRKSEDHTNTYLYHQQFTLLHHQQFIFVSPTIYFTLLHH